jgi:hypothetical protein
MEKIWQRQTLKWFLILMIVLIQTYCMSVTEYTIIFLPVSIYLILKIYQMKIKKTS